MFHCLNEENTCITGNDAYMVYSWMNGACEWKVCEKLPYVNVCIILYSTCNVRKCIRWFKRIDTLDYLISLQTSCVLYYINFLLKLYKIDGYLQTLFIQMVLSCLYTDFHISSNILLPTSHGYPLWRKLV